MPDGIIEKAAQSAIVSATGPAGTVAKYAMKVLQFADSQNEKRIRDKAREILGCKHIVVCPHGTFNSRQSDMIDYVKHSRGMAFVYESIALGHPCDDMDVKRLSTQVFRHQFVDGKDSFTDSPKHNAMSCSRCMTERVG
jgi:hypothetical protein